MAWRSGGGGPPERDMFRRARRERMADEIRNGESKVRVVRLLGHRDDAGAWQIRDFLKRSVVEFQWIELSTEEDCRRELGLSDLKLVERQ
jgi:hypothetical protein